MVGEIIWFSAPDKIGYVMREGKRMVYSAPLMYFFNEASFPEMNIVNDKNLVGQKVEFETMFSSTLDEDVIKNMRLL